MANWLKGGKYAYKRPTNYRSGLEDRLATQIKAYETPRYECYKLKYEIPASNHTYTPDFILQNNIIIEAKGIFEADDRKKHLLIQKQYPNLDIRFIFQNPNNKIYKGSKTTYGQWCDKHGFKWSTRVIPAKWFIEPTKDITGVYPLNDKGR